MGSAGALLVGSAWHAGGEKFLARMQALVAELGLKESVVFTGFRNDVPQIYRDLDVSVQASLNENLGGTIESLLMQCPTVATRVGGLTDSVVDGVTGVLVAPADPADLAQGILRLWRDPKHARALGEAGRARMLARFTLSKTIADLHALYLSQARAPGHDCESGESPSLSFRGRERKRAEPGIHNHRPGGDDGLLSTRKDAVLGLWIPSSLAVGKADSPAPQNDTVGQVLTQHNYGNAAFLWRLIVAGGFCCGLALRFLVMDCWLLPSWDQGWRPWRLKSWTVVARMWLYLAYAVVGRLLPSFGLRHRVCASHAIMMIRLRNGWCGLRAMPRMLVYRGYGTASRGARALGLRRPESIDTLPSPDFA